MKIVIAGAGAVGSNLAEELSVDKHDITVIESDPVLVERLRGRLDVHTINGSVTDAEVLRLAGVSDADIFIAVTNVDEVNIVSSTLAHHLGAKRRIARVRNPMFSGQNAVANKREFHINRIVNPDILAAETAMRLIASPGLTFQAEFAAGEVLLRAFRLPEDSGIHGMPLKELARKFEGRPFIIAAVERDGDVLIPRGDDVLRIDDTVYLLMLKDAEDRFRELIHSDERRIGRIVVYGADAVGVDLARRLATVAKRVIVVDERRAQAELASERLPGALVLHGWVSDEEVQHEIDFKNVDVFVAAAQDDRMNLVAALYANRRGATRTLVFAREPDIVPLLNTLEFDAVINARLLAVSEISRFVRPGKVLSVQKIGEGGAEAVEMLVSKGSKAAKKSLRDLKLPEGALVGAVFRDGQAQLPTGDTVLEVGDDIVAFVVNRVREKVEALFTAPRKIRFEG
ncbi:MAG: Trk system potassium transporter TrkA [Planctomycetes bacterium]|nr:Trk system potassium transporter TrkA [Planctomycetota bacterium]MCC7171329.1 Trk system potassium transporter TrkA [Planctomycetota bacterium]